MKKILILIICSFHIHLFAQQVLWLKKLSNHSLSFSDMIARSATDSEGNLFRLAELDTLNDISIIYKVDTSGVLINQKIFPENFWINDIGINSENELLIIGEFSGSIMFGSENFISSGADDILFAAFDTDFQFIWGKKIDGAFNDKGKALAIDFQDNIFIAGGISDSVNFADTILNCNENGNSFLAKFDPFGQLTWIIKDSSDEYLYYSYTYGTDIFINNNNELLLTGKLNHLSYFYFNNIQMTIPPLDLEGYNYGYTYAIKMDLNGNCSWSKCIKQPHSERFSYTGLTMSNSFIIGNDSYEGESSKIIINDNNGLSYKTIYVGANEESTTHYLATIDDHTYFSAKKNYYDSPQDHYRNYITAVVNDELVILDSTIGYIGAVSLVKTGNSEFILTGVFQQSLVAGNDTIISDSTVTPLYVENKWNPFIAKFKFPSLSCDQNPSVSNTSICSNSSASLTATGISTLGWYSQDSGGTYLGSGTNFITPILNNTTTYYVQDSICASVSGRTAVLVSVNPLPIVNAYASSSTVCAGDALILNATGANSYAWSDGITNGIPFTIYATNTYTVIGTDENNCSDTATITINVNSLPEVNTDLNGATISANQSGAIYQWLDCNENSLIPNATNQSFSPEINGDYAVIVSMEGCIDTSECVNINSVGISYFSFGEGTGIRVFPNPTHGTFTIQSSEKISSISITNLIGEKIFEQHTPLSFGKGLGVRFSQPKGIYFLKVVTQNSREVRKIVLN